MTTLLAPARPESTCATAGHPRSRRRRPAVAAVAAALVVRTVLALTRDGHGFDTRCFQEWGHLLANAPWGRFYDLTTCGDHLPGDLLVHGALARAATLLGIEVPSPAYALVLKAAACGWDLALALAVWRLAGRRAALVVLLVPVLWLDSAWWGQWDALSLALALWGLVLLRRPDPAGWLGVPLLAWAVLVKPPLALLAAPLVLWHCARRGPRLLLPRLAGATVLGAATAQLLGAPFGVGLPGTGARWSLLQRVAASAGEYDAATLGATNVWMWLAQPPASSDATRLLGLPLRAWGIGATVAWCAACALLARARRDRLPGVLAPLWCGVGMLAGWHLLATRAHERYAIPAAVLAVVLAALLPGDRWARGAAWLLGLPATGTLLLSLTGLGSPGLRLGLYRLLALLTAAGCVALVRAGSPPPPSRTSPGGLPATAPAHAPRTRRGPGVT